MLSIKKKRKRNTPGYFANKLRQIARGTIQDRVVLFWNMNEELETWAEVESYTAN